ncbi:MAG TPA: DUF4381 domain-containing protein, partial [Gammaproteobacteria bacterium]|nr:DUF4381 domain-containing protein [Gammaproteobacteria bacterium]
MNPTIDFSELPLRDIHLPGLIGWWPPALGWWLLAVLALGGLILLGLYYYRRRQQRAALRALGRLRAALEQGAEPVGCLQQLSTVLRRFAMTTASLDAHDPSRHADVAGLIGEHWLTYLDSRWQRDTFRRGPGRLLLAAPYSRPTTIGRDDALALTALCTDWLRQQQPRSGGVSARNRG